MASHSTTPARKPRTPKAAPAVKAADLPATIEQIATGKAGTTEVRIDIAGTTEKLVTDRIRRLPRLKGWSSLGVKRVSLEGDLLVLAITSSGQAALPWPTKATPAKATPAKATKATPRKATTKAAPRKATPRKASSKG